MTAAEFDQDAEYWTAVYDARLAARNAAARAARKPQHVRRNAAAVRTVALIAQSVFAVRNAHAR